MLQIFNCIFAGPKNCSENSAIVNRLRKQSERSNKEISESEAEIMHAPINARNQAVLLSAVQGESNRRNCWPKMSKPSPAVARPGNGDKFWERAVTPQRQDLNNRKQILGGLRWR